MSKNKFPMRIEKGNSRVTIYYHRNGNYDEFKVGYFKDGKRRMETYADFERAKAKADAINDSVNLGQLELASFDRSEYRDYTHAAELLSSAGIALSLANIAMQFVEAKKILGGTSLIEAAQFFKNRCGHVIAKPTSEIADEFLKTKVGKVCKQYSQGISRFMGKFQAVFKGVDLVAIKGADLNRFLSEPSSGCESDTGCRRARRRGYRAATYNCRRSLLLEFYAFAVREKYLPADAVSLVSNIDTRDEIDSGSVEIYTPQELRMLLDACEPSHIESVSSGFKPWHRRMWGDYRQKQAHALRVYIALAAFTGIRSAELLKLRWEDVGVGRGYIQIKPENAKTRRRRLVPITENLRKWLAPYQKASGPIFRPAKVDLRRDFMSRPFANLARSVGIKAKHNGFRHSFISYRVAQTGDVSKTSLEAGNSPKVIFKHYLELVTPEAAAEWFAICPSEADKKITYLSTATA